jgi:hypothetical protein
MRPIRISSHQKKTYQAKAAAAAKQAEEEKMASELKAKQEADAKAQAEAEAAKKVNMRHISLIWWYHFRIPTKAYNSNKFSTDCQKNRPRLRVIPIRQYRSIKSTK